MRSDPADGEVGCAAGAQRLTGYVFWEVASESLDKPRSSGYGAVGPQPELGVEGEMLIARL